MDFEFLEQVSTGLRALKDLERLFGGIRNIRTTVESFLDFVDALEHAVVFSLLFLSLHLAPP